MTANDSSADKVAETHVLPLDKSTTEKIELHQVEEAQYQLNRIDLDLLSKESIDIKSRAALRLLVVILVQGLSVAAFAIDGSVIGGVSALVAFRDYFNVGTSGSGIGIIVAAMSIGNAVGSLFQWLSDYFGRRGVSFSGNIILIIGCVLQAAAVNNAMFIMGRVIAGFGCSLSATVGPLYMSEVAPACWRGLIVGLYCSCYSIGAIVMSCVLFGGSYIVGDWSWRFPMVFQIAPPVIVACLIYPCTPESPRYLYSVGKLDEARSVLARYHTTSEDLHAPLVDAEMEQIRESMERVDTKPWDFSPLYKTSSNRFRLLIIVLYSFYQQWNGAGMLQYYLPAVLSGVGITNSQQLLGINIGQTVAGWLSVLVGATFVDKVNRRTLMTISWAVFVVFLGLMAIVAGLYDNGKAESAMGYLMITLVYIFVICNGLFVSVLHNIYPNEVLHYSQRAKGMGAYSFFQNCFGFAMTYGGSAAIAALGWKIYFLFMGINISAIVVTYFIFPEFRQLSLEEIDIIFETPGTHPVKLSKKLQEAKKQKRKEREM